MCTTPTPSIGLCMLEHSKQFNHMTKKRNTRDFTSIQLAVNAFTAHVNIRRAAISGSERHTSLACAWSISQLHKTRACTIMHVPSLDRSMTCSCRYCWPAKACSVNMFTNTNTLATRPLELLCACTQNTILAHPRGIETSL